MKKTELIKIIELVVRKEVKKQVNEIFINDNKTSLTELVSAPKDEKKFKEIFIKDNDRTSLTELVSDPVIKKELKKPITKQYKIKPKKEIVYTDNVELNRVLNETAGGVPQGEGGYETMGGGVYDSERMSELLGYGNVGGDKETQRKVAAVDSIQKAGMKVDDVPDHVQNALTKDYSKVMKAIENKKGGTNYRP